MLLCPHIDSRLPSASIPRALPLLQARQQPTPTAASALPRPHSLSFCNLTTCTSIPAAANPRPLSSSSAGPCVANPRTKPGRQPRLLSLLPDSHNPAAYPCTRKCCSGPLRAAPLRRNPLLFLCRAAACPTGRRQGLPTTNPRSASEEPFDFFDLYGESSLKLVSIHNLSMSTHIKSEFVYGYPTIISWRSSGVTRSLTFEDPFDLLSNPCKWLA